MLTYRDIALLMNRHSQDGNNDSPWWLLFRASCVERAAVEDECKQHRFAADHHGLGLLALP